MEELTCSGINMWLEWKNKFLNALDEVAPMVSFRRRKKCLRPWMTPELLHLMHKRVCFGKINVPHTERRPNQTAPPPTQLHNQSIQASPQPVLKTAPKRVVERPHVALVGCQPCNWTTQPTPPTVSGAINFHRLFLNSFSSLCSSMCVTIRS